jgi:hypothetical protein
LEDPGVDGRIILKWIFEILTLSIYNIEYIEDFREVGCGGADWVDLAQDRDRWRAVVYTVMNLRVLQNAENFLSNLEFVSFSGRTFLDGVSLVSTCEENRVVHIF